MNNLETVKPNIVFDLEISVPELPKIEHNLDKLENVISELKKFYDVLVIDENEVDNLLKDKTDINKILKKIEDNRKENVKKFKEPIDDFETTSKNIEKMLKGIVATINDKTNVFIEQQKEEKREQIFKLYDEVYNELLDEYKSYVTPSLVQFDERWYNKGYDLTKKAKVNEIKAEIRTQYEDIIEQVLNTEKDIDVITKYFQSFNKNMLNLDKYIERYRHTSDLQQVMTDIKNDYDLENRKIDEIPQEELDSIFSDDIDSIFDISTKEVTIKGDSDKIGMVINYAKQLGLEVVENGR